MNFKSGDDDETPFFDVTMEGAGQVSNPRSPDSPVEDLSTTPPDAQGVLTNHSTEEK